MILKGILLLVVCLILVAPALVSDKLIVNDDVPVIQGRVDSDKKIL